MRHEAIRRLGPQNVDGQFNIFTFAQAIQNAWNGPRNSRPHQDIIDLGQHGAKQRRQCRQLQFFHEVDADKSVMMLLGEKHLHKVGNDAKLDAFPRHQRTRHRMRHKRRLRRLAAGDIIASQDFSGNFREWETFQGPPNMTARIAE